MRISDWSSDVCSSDLVLRTHQALATPCQCCKGETSASDGASRDRTSGAANANTTQASRHQPESHSICVGNGMTMSISTPVTPGPTALDSTIADRSEEHTSELQSLMRTSYAVLRLQKNN